LIGYKLVYYSLKQMELGKEADKVAIDIDRLKKVHDNDSSNCFRGDGNGNDDESNDDDDNDNNDQILSLRESMKSLQDNLPSWKYSTTTEDFQSWGDCKIPLTKWYQKMCSQIISDSPFKEEENIVHYHHIIS
jgi:hypothetical protein